LIIGHSKSFYLGAQGTFNLGFRVNTWFQCFSSGGANAAYSSSAAISAAAAAAAAAAAGLCPTLRFI